MYTQYKIKGSALEQLSELVHFLLNNNSFQCIALRKPHSALACHFLYKWNLNEYYIKVKSETLYLGILLKLHENRISDLEEIIMSRYAGIMTCCEYG